MTGEHAVVGPYRIVKAIGAGGSARIDLARIDRAYGFQRHVVIKRPLEHLRSDASVAASLRREAHLGGQLRHPNLVAVLDAGEHDGYDYLALEYIHGASLRTLMQPPGAADTGAVRALPLATALSIVIEVARGLHEAHELAAADGTSLGLVHRDVSPNNILLGADGTVKLADFGIAKDTRVSTLSGSMRGTVTYMAPEQCRGHAFDRRADVFSLGVILFELVTARRLFWADNDVASLHKVLSGVIPDPRTLVPGLAPELAQLLLSAVASDPDARFATTAALADELEAFAVRAGIATSARNVARIMESALGVHGAPWIAAAPATTTLVAPEAEVSLVGVIESTPDEPEPEFAPPAADVEPTVIDPPRFAPDEDRTLAAPPLVFAEDASSARPAGAPIVADAHRPRAAPLAADAHRPDAAPPVIIGRQLATSHRRRRWIAAVVLALSGAAVVAVVAASSPDETPTTDSPVEAESNQETPAATHSPVEAESKTGSEPVPVRQPDTGSAAAAGTSEDLGSDAPSAIEIEPADAKQRRRRRTARDAAAKAAAAKAAATPPATATAPAAPRDASVAPDDAAPARVEWKPTLLLPTDDPKAPAKRRTP
jgi:serine/threonine-protein kinase